MTDQILSRSETEPGRFGALLVYVLYLLSIPSAAMFALIGVVIAYVAREGAAPGARQHFNEQIRIWWVAFAWGLGLIFASAIGWTLTIVLIGFPIIWITAVIGLVVMIWFTVKSAVGLIALLGKS